MPANPEPALAPNVRRRRWRRRLILLVLATAVLVAALPSLLSLGPVKSLVVGRINAALAPGSVVVQSWTIGWLAPIHVDGMALVDPQGKQVVAARAVRLDWGILGLLMARPDLGTITVEHAKVDVERRVDGTVDILDAIARVTETDPHDPEKRSDGRRAVKVVIKDSTLRANSPELAEPIVVGDLAATLTIAPGKPTTLAATLLDGDRSLKVDAAIVAPALAAADSAKEQAQVAAAASDLAIQVVGKDWPLTFRGEGGVGRGRFAGTIDARRTAGLWVATAVAALEGFEADGPALRGDHPKFDRVTLVADLGQKVDGAGWSVRRFEMACPAGKLQGAGSVPPVEGSATQLRGQVDLSALAKLLPHTLQLQEGVTVDGGVATLTADLTGLKGAERAGLAASVKDFAATRSGRAVAVPEFPRVEAVAVRDGSRVKVERLAIKATGVDVAASGDLDAGLILKGTVDLGAVTNQVRDLVDLKGVTVAGHARLAADYRHVGDGYRARVAADCKDLDVVGLTAEPIRRDLARLDASATGPRLGDGRPDGWTTARVDLKAGDVQLDATGVREPDGTVRLGALAASDLPGAYAGPGGGWAEAKVAARWKANALDIDELRAWLMPTGSKATHKAGPETLAVAARGRLDLGAGAVALEAIPDVAVGAVALGPGGLRVSGWKAEQAPIQVEGGLIGDMAALDRWLAARSQRAAHGWSGPWSVRGSGSRDAAGAARFDAQATADDLLGHGPAALAARGTYRPDGDRLDLETANLNTKYSNIVSRLSLAGLTTTRVLDWSGTLDPHWDVVGPILAHAVEPGAKLTAKARPFRLAGSVQGDSLAAILPRLAGELGFDVASVSAFGVEAGPLALVLKLDKGRMQFDPMATHVNGGPALLQGGLALDQDGGLWLRLDESRIDDAAINDAVSSAVLAFIAPVLSRATEVNGKVSVVLSPEGAMIPLTADGQIRASGVTAFKDVVFRPGPLADQVFSLTGKAAPTMKFDEPIQFAIANGRVRQSGLTIPVAAGAKVELAGSVGFDKTLKVEASVPITAAMVGRDAELEQLLDGLKVKVPIGGTLAKPVLDRRGLQAATRDAIRTVASRKLQGEANRLVDRVAKGTLKGAGAAATDAAKAGDPKRDLLRGLLEGLGKDALEGGKKP